MADDSDVEVEYELEEFQLAEYKVNVTTIAYMPITILMKNREKETEISGQKLWCGSICLINQLLAEKSIVRNNHVIELGAGTGVLSMICHKIGSNKIFATDHDPRSLQHMTDDLKRNGTDSIHVTKLDWFQNDLGEIRNNIGSLDENEKVIVLAGDVLYKNALLDPFFQTVQNIFNTFPDKCELYLCHVPRAGVDQCHVVEKAQSMGFKVQQLEFHQTEHSESILSQCDKDDLVRAKIYHIHL